MGDLSLVHALGLEIPSSRLLDTFGDRLVAVRSLPPNRGRAPNPLRAPVHGHGHVGHMGHVANVDVAANRNEKENEGTAEIVQTPVTENQDSE